MTSYFDIITAATIVVIGVVLTIYLSILWKNGWIGRASHYRCPNLQCRKIFEKPLRVKDYSNKKHVRLACPECKCDLGASNDDKAVRETTVKSKAENNSAPTLIEVTNENSVSTANNSKESIVIKSVHPTQTKTPVSTITSISQEHNAAETVPPFIELEENKSLPERDEKDLVKQKKDNRKGDKPMGCSHYFGYLASLPKNTATPDACYSCTKLIECFIERRAYSSAF